MVLHETKFIGIIRKFDCWKFDQSLQYMRRIVPLSLTVVKYDPGFYHFTYVDLRMLVQIRTPSIHIEYTYSEINGREFDKRSNADVGLE